MVEPTMLFPAEVTGPSQLGDAGSVLPNRMLFFIVTEPPTPTTRTPPPPNAELFAAMVTLFRLNGPEVEMPPPLPDGALLLLTVLLLRLSVPVLAMPAPPRAALL